MSDLQRSKDNSDHEVPRKQPSGAMTFALFALLLMWVISIALGTVIFGTDPEQDPRTVSGWVKPLLVLLPMGLFLTLWAVLLLRKYSRSTK